MLRKKIFKVLCFFFSTGLISCVSSSDNLELESMSLISQAESETFAVFGHKNPDLDSYGSSYAYVRLLQKLGFKAKAYALGEPNLETKFVLKFLNENPLPVLKALPTNSKAILLDHNEEKHSLDGLKKSQIVQIIDHHRLILKTPDTVSLEIEKVGSTASLIYKRYLDKNIKPDYTSAAFMLAALLSDTRTLTSPTTTEFDKKICSLLSKETGLYYKKFGADILLAGTKTDNLTVERLHQSDLKFYDFSGEKVSIAVINTTGIEETLKRREELLSYMKKFREKENLSFSVLLLTDLFNHNSHALVVGNKDRFNKAFSHKAKGDDYFLDKVVSRKRQVVPKLEKQI